MSCFTKIEPTPLDESYLSTYTTPPTPPLVHSPLPVYSSPLLPSLSYDCCEQQYYDSPLPTNIRVYNNRLTVATVPSITKSQPSRLGHDDRVLEHELKRKRGQIQTLSRGFKVARIGSCFVCGTVCTAKDHHSKEQKKEKENK